MPITRERKEELVAKYVDLLDQSTGFVLIQFDGLSVQETQNLRRKVREAEGQYLVAKNTLLTKALQQQGWPVPDDMLSGPTAVAFGLDNMPGVAKAVIDFTEDKLYQERISVKGGIMTGAILDPSKIESVSKLPTLDEIRSQLAGLIVSPAQGIVSVIQRGTGAVVDVLQAYLDDQQGDGDGEGEAA